MLTFEKTADCYRITETICGWFRTQIKTVDYKFDLSESRCNNDPWHPTIDADRDWFNKYYKHKFSS